MSYVAYFAKTTVEKKSRFKYFMKWQQKPPIKTDTEFINEAIDEKIERELHGDID